jgi:hypothetical protein
MRMDVQWPEDAKAGLHSRLRLYLQAKDGKSRRVNAKIPLPPGVTLAAHLDGVHQVQGNLLIEQTVEPSMFPTIMEIPVRFGLAGQFLVPEARVRDVGGFSERSIYPARPLVVR